MAEEILNVGSTEEVVPTDEVIEENAGVEEVSDESVEEDVVEDEVFDDTEDEEDDLAA